MFVFSVYDSKAECYLQPLFFRSRGDAIRSFSDEANNDKSKLHIHAEDFTLFQLGAWDEANANFDLNPSPIAIGVASEFRKEPPDMLS